MPIFLDKGKWRKQEKPPLEFRMRLHHNLYNLFFSDYRGYTVRRKYGPEIEARVRQVLASCSDPMTAQQALEVPTIFFHFQADNHFFKSKPGSASHADKKNMPITIVTPA